MTSFEQMPPTERPCATCPNRSKLSQLLAQVGIFASGKICAGPDTIDRFTAVKIVGADPSPEDSGDYRSLANDPFSENSQPTVKYLSQDEVRTKPCSRDPILLGSDEMVTEARVNALGKVRAKIGKGNPEDIEMLKNPFEPDLFNNGQSPLEVLRAVRLVTIDTSESTQP